MFERGKGGHLYLFIKKRVLPEFDHIAVSPIYDSNVMTTVDEEGGKI